MRPEFSFFVENFKEVDVSVPVCHPGLEEKGAAYGKGRRQVDQVERSLGLPRSNRHIAASRRIRELQYLVFQILKVEMF